ncbi:hypothetical protein DA01_02595 [Dehalococcoides mccartyi]|uniref:Uncharacterized protein n=1 Tax=Dehalococcoides mccartyi TaxID=61435 RepID=A0A0V8M3H8_9CHLR|nr:hypothetical protein [Dehalococcoides mccartyi]KSV18332.1 hypothetical protein DA01_02595 [Dehalococcoides mccartyi]
MPAMCKNSLPLYANLLEADYTQVPALSWDELRNFTYSTIEKWEEGNCLSAADLTAALEFIKYNIPLAGIKYLDNPAIPICYFSKVIPKSAEVLQSLLQIEGIKSYQMPILQKPDGSLDLELDDRHKILIVTIPQYNHLNSFKNFLQVMQPKKLTILAGGNVFYLKPSLKLNFGSCIFPENIKDIIWLINKINPAASEEKV